MQIQNQKLNAVKKKIDAKTTVDETVGGRSSK